MHFDIFGNANKFLYEKTSHSFSMVSGKLNDLFFGAHRPIAIEFFFEEFENFEVVEFGGESFDESDFFPFSQGLWDVYDLHVVVFVDVCGHVFEIYFHVYN